jgi:hypothetical protein
MTKLPLSPPPGLQVVFIVLVTYMYVDWRERPNFSYHVFYSTYRAMENPN